MGRSFPWRRDPMKSEIAKRRQYRRSRALASGPDDRQCNQCLSPRIHRPL